MQQNVSRVYSLKNCALAQQLEATHLLQIEPLDSAVLRLIVYTFLPSHPASSRKAKLYEDITPIRATAALVCAGG